MKGFHRVLAVGAAALLTTACSSESPVGMDADLVPSAVVAVVDRPLTVAKTAAGTYDRTVRWELSKSVNPSSHAGAPGDAFSSNWTVTATKSAISGNYAVAGTITVTNPNTVAVPFTLADVLNDGTAATITCPVTNDNTGTAPAGGSVTCAYTATPPNGSATLNTATVSFNVGAGPATATATAAVSFTETLIGDEQVTLSDPRVAFSTLISSTTVEIFPEPFTCPADLGLYVDGIYTGTFTNTAYLDGSNTDLEASAEVSVRCVVPPSDVCTLTPGYWKTHSRFGPAPYDATWAKIGENTPFFLSGKSWYQAINTAPAGNAYYILSHAYIASALNFEAGASKPAAVSAAFNEATALLSLYTPAQVAAMRGNNPTRAAFVRVAKILDDYNNGITGPGHCG